ncbi:MAG: SulP family inorganic anion transporter [Bacteroidetes bacterium]|nr:SulP family inorganic anion transporter [Bacteroidota bacterium]
MSFIPTSFVTVLVGTLLALAFASTQSLSLTPNQYVTIPKTILDQMQIPKFHLLLETPSIWKYGIVIALVASLETLLSIEAIDKIDPQNRITPQNRELIAQGTGNLLSGILGGLPITAVIVRSAANAEAGARTRLSGIFHGVWLILVIVLASSLVNYIPMRC